MPASFTQASKPPKASRALAAAASRASLSATSAAVAQFLDDLPEIVLVAGHQYDLRAPLGGEPGGGKADAGTRAGDDDGLLRKRLAAEFRRHVVHLSETGSGA
jgi:hypothetical protein